jgi:C1A family cysteine protease
MKAFVNFIAEMSRTYTDKSETAARYRNFKNNYYKVQKHQVHEQHLPYTVTMSNRFADLSPEEFISQIGAESIVPKNVMTPTTFSARAEFVPFVDKKEDGLPIHKNWFEEGKIGASQDQLPLQCASSWAFASVGALEGLSAIKGTQAELSV